MSDSEDRCCLCFDVRGCQRKSAQHNQASKEGKGGRGVVLVSTYPRYIFFHFFELFAYLAAIFSTVNAVVLAQARKKGNKKRHCSRRVLLDLNLCLFYFLFPVAALPFLLKRPTTLVAAISLFVCLLAS